MRSRMGSRLLFWECNKLDKEIEQLQEIIAEQSRLLERAKCYEESLLESVRVMSVRNLEYARKIHEQRRKISALEWLFQMSAEEAAWHACGSTREEDIEKYKNGLKAQCEQLGGGNSNGG